MKRIAGLILILGLHTANAFADIRYLVLDIHETSAYRTTPESVRQDPSNIIYFGNYPVLRLSDLYIEALTYLHRTGKFKISIMSNGSDQEIKPLAALIESQIEGFQFLSDGTKRGWGMGAGKDIFSLHPEMQAHPGDSILVDDKRHNAARGQERNLLWIGPAFEDDPVYRERPASSGGFWGGDTTPSTRQDWALERNKMAWMVGVVVTADETADANHSFAMRVFELTHDRTSGNIPYPKNHPTQVELTKKGLELLGFGDASPTERVLVAPRTLPSVQPRQLGVATPQQRPKETISFERMFQVRPVFWDARDFLDFYNPDRIQEVQDGVRLQEVAHRMFLELENKLDRFMGLSPKAEDLMDFLEFPLAFGEAPIFDGAIGSQILETYERIMTRLLDSQTHFKDWIQVSRFVPAQDSKFQQVYQRVLIASIRGRMPKMLHPSRAFYVVRYHGHLIRDQDFCDELLALIRASYPTIPESEWEEIKNLPNLSKDQVGVAAVRAMIALGGTREFLLGIVKAALSEGASLVLRSEEYVAAETALSEHLVVVKNGDLVQIKGKSGVVVALEFCKKLFGSEKKPN